MGYAWGMEVFIGAFLLMFLAVAGMAVGVVFGGRQLSGSCGGRLPDGTLVGDCLCEKAREKALKDGEAAPEGLCDLSTQAS